MVASPTAQREAMQMQQHYANIQVLQNIVMAQVLWEDEKSGAEDAKAIRAIAKAKLREMLDGMAAAPAD